MSERDEMLARFNAQHGLHAPTTDTNLRKVASVFRETIKDQGQVMSLALDNNKNLYESNKDLRRKVTELLEDIRRAEASLARRDAAVAELTAHVERLQVLTPGVADLAAHIEECAKWKTTAAEYRRVLESYLYDELNQTQLRAKLDEMKAQHTEIVETDQVYVAKEEAD